MLYGAKTHPCSGGGGTEMAASQHKLVRATQSKVSSFVLLCALHRHETLLC